MVYILLLVYSFYCATVYRKRNREWAKIHYFLLLTFTVLVFGLRYRIGIDTLRYIDHYTEIKDLFHIKVIDFQETDYAPLFVTLFSFGKTLSTNFTAFQFIHSLILNACVFYFVKKHAINPFLAISFYFTAVGLYFNTEILRESLAVSVFILNFKNVEKKQWVKYFIWSFIAIGFHYSAIITLIVPLFSRLRINFKLVVYLSFYFVLVLLMAYYITNVGIPIELLSYRYSGQIDFKEYADITFAYYIGVVIKGVIFPTIVLACNKKYRIYQNAIIEPMVILFSIISATSIAYPLIFDRLSNYFILFFIASLANCFSTPRFKYSLIGILLFTLINVFFIYFNVKPGTLERYYPYSSILDPQKNPAREKLFSLDR